MKELKKQVNRTARGILFYNIIILAAILMDVLIKSIHLMLKYRDEALLNEAFHRLELSLGLYGTSSIVGIITGILFLALYFRRDKMKNRIFAAAGKMVPSVFFQAALVLLGAQFIFNLLSVGAESCLNAAGYTMMSQIESASQGSTSISMFLYASLLGPAAEEIVYRGFVMQSLRNCGKIYAIIVSSLIFGVMHANFIQGIFAFCVGTVLAYVTLEYSIYWAILLHVINNFVMGDLWTYLISIFSENVQAALNWGITIMLFAGGLIVLWRNRVKLRNYIKENMVSSKYYMYTFTSLWMILFLIIEFVLALDGIKKLV